MGPYLHEAENQPSCSQSVSSSVATDLSLTNGQSHEDLENHRENWTEFKRFKNCVKTRKYRSHSKSEDD